MAVSYGGANPPFNTNKGGPMRLAPSPARPSHPLGAANPNLPNVPGRAAPKVPAPRAPKPVKPPAIKPPAAPANPYALANTALTNPNATLSGTALQQAAQALADAQTKGPLAELAMQIALNQRQTAAAQKNTAGYFNQLGQFVTQGNQQLGNISNDLNSQLANIGNQTQGAIGNAFQPGQGLSNLASSGLASGAMGSLDAARAGQQGFAAQDAQAFRANGATQGANYRSLGASNLGTYALRGQETLGRIGQAGQLENEPLNEKTAGLLASKGALYSTALGRLRQQEITNSITRAGLGLDVAKLNATIQNNNANQGIKNRGLDITAAHNRAVERIAKINTALAGGRLSETQRHNLITERTGLINATTGQGRLSETNRHNLATERNRGGGGAGGGLSLNEQNHRYSEIDQIQGLIRQGRAYRDKHGQPLTGAQIKNKLLAHYNATEVEAAYELLGWGGILPKTAAGLHQLGLRGGRYRVLRNSPAGQGVAGAAGSVAGGVGNLNPFR